MDAFIIRPAILLNLNTSEKEESPKCYLSFIIYYLFIIYVF
jgi:hypothetical protein